MQQFHEIPGGSDWVGPGWLSRTLRASGAIGGATVTGVESSPLGEARGFLSRIVRLDLDYDREADRKSVV